MREACFLLTAAQNKIWNSLSWNIIIRRKKNYGDFHKQFFVLEQWPKHFCFLMTYIWRYLYQKGLNVIKSTRMSCCHWLANLIYITTRLLNLKYYIWQKKTFKIDILGCVQAKDNNKVLNIVCWWIKKGFNGLRPNIVLKSLDD